MPTDTIFETPPAMHRLVAAEDRHFWFRARNRVIGRIVKQLTEPLPSGFRVLEVGCGTGNVLRVLEEVCERGEVTGLDNYDESLAYARLRTKKAQLVKADIHRMPFDQPFELIGMFDVLEHLPDDERVLRDLYAALRPGGRIVLTVPAHMALWSYFDEISGHYRRYTTGQLHGVLRAAGFQVDFVSQFMTAIYPLMWLGRRLAALRKSTTKDETAQKWDLAYKEMRIVPILNTLAEWALAWEGLVLGRRGKLPIGTSILAIATKPDSAAQPLAKAG